MTHLFPEISPYATHRLKVDEPHELYIEECGNEKGIPVIFIHGGPGAGCEPYHRRFFDPNIYRILLFDQRGSGQSTPHASLEQNTSQHLVADMETIREYLSISEWVLFGGSWGSTLGLLYAETHPQQVLALILRGIFLCRPQEIHWFYQEGASRFFPDHWQNFIHPIPEEERGDLLRAHYKRLTGDNELARMASAKAWSIWEGHCSTLLPKKSVVEFFSSPHTALSLARIEAHYFINNSFLEDNQLLRDIDRIKDIPGIIVHGRYDLICPLESAWALHRAWTESQLQIIPDAGHSASETGIVNTLVASTEQISTMLINR